MSPLISHLFPQGQVRTGPQVMPGPPDAGAGLKEPPRTSWARLKQKEGSELARRLRWRLRLRCGSGVGKGGHGKTRPRKMSQKRSKRRKGRRGQGTNKRDLSRRRQQRASGLEGAGRKEINNTSATGISKYAGLGQKEPKRTFVPRIAPTRPGQGMVEGGSGRHCRCDAPGGAERLPVEPMAMYCT